MVGWFLFWQERAKILIVEGLGVVWLIAVWIVVGRAFLENSVSLKDGRDISRRAGECLPACSLLESTEACWYEAPESGNKVSLPCGDYSWKDWSGGAERIC